MLAVSDGLRVGFLNDRQPFLSLQESRLLVTALKEKGLVKETLGVLNLGDQEIIFVNTEGLVHFVTGQQPSFQLLEMSNPFPKLVPHSCHVSKRIVVLVTGSMQKHESNLSELVLHPSKDITGSTLLGICLGYPVVYLFQSDFQVESLVQYELHAKSGIPELSSVHLFSFTVPHCIDAEVAPHIAKWYHGLLSKCDGFSSIESISLHKNLKSALNVIF